MTDHPKPRPPHTGCPTCGHATNHDGHPVTQIACDTTAFERDRAAAWLAFAAKLPDDEAARVIRKLSTAAWLASTTGLPHDEAARIILDILLGLGWRPGGDR